MKHSIDCKMVFGRKDANCPRCQELMAGAAPRAGWQKDYYTSKARREANERLAIAAHFAPGGPHALGKCGPVCTALLDLRHNLKGYKNEQTYNIKPHGRQRFRNHESNNESAEEGGP